MATLSRMFLYTCRIRAPVPSAGFRYAYCAETYFLILAEIAGQNKAEPILIVSIPVLSVFEKVKFPQPFVVLFRLTNETARKRGN